MSKTLTEQATDNGAKIVGEELDMQQFEFDPYTASLPNTIARLVYNSYEKSNDAYNEKSGKPPVPQWVMGFEDGLRQDFNDQSSPRILTNRINLAYWRMKDRDGIDLEEPKLVKHGKKSTPVEFASQSFQSCKINLMPSAAQQYLEDWFQLVQMTFGAESPFPKKLWVPIKHLGSNIPQEVLDYRARREEQEVGSW